MSLTFSLDKIIFLALLRNVNFRSIYNTDSQARFKDARILLKDWVPHGKFHCKYITHYFHVVFSSVCCFHFYVCALFLFLGMSKVDTPSPHSSKKHDKKCDSCHAFLSDLDPHPICPKCVPRGCSKESPCSHCAPLSLDAWKKWECQQATSSLGIAQNNQVSAPSGQPQQQWSGAIPQGVQLPYTQGTNEIPMEQALNRVFPRGIPAVMEQFLAPAMEPDFGSFRRQSGQSSLDSVISLQELWSDVMACFPGYQVESSDPAPIRPTSLGLANFQQA